MTSLDVEVDLWDQYLFSRDAGAAFRGTGVVVTVPGLYSECTEADFRVHRACIYAQGLYLHTGAVFMHRGCIHVRAFIYAQGAKG